MPEGTKRFKPTKEALATFNKLGPLNIEQLVKADVVVLCHMQDEKIQTFLKESYTTEKMMMLKDHRKIEQVIEPQKWDVLIRIIDDKADALSGGTRSESKSSEQKSSLTAHELRYA